MRGTAFLAVPLIPCMTRVFSIVYIILFLAVVCSFGEKCRQIADKNMSLSEQDDRLTDCMNIHFANCRKIVDDDRDDDYNCN